MAQISVDGQVISEIELKTSAKNNPYVRFEIVAASTVFSRMRFC